MLEPKITEKLSIKTRDLSSTLSEWPPEEVKRANSCVTGAGPRGPTENYLSCKSPATDVHCGQGLR